MKKRVCSLETPSQSAHQAVIACRLCDWPPLNPLAPSLLMPPTLALFHTPYADWIYTVVSTTGLLLIVWLTLRPRP